MIICLALSKKSYFPCVLSNLLENQKRSKKSETYRIVNVRAKVGKI